MTAEEIAALPIGTEVLVRAKLDAILAGDGLCRLSLAPSFGIYARAHSIHSIAPPKPLEVGDRCKVTATAGVFEIVAIHERQAWCSDSTSICWTYDLNDLTRI